MAEKTAVIAESYRTATVDAAPVSHANGVERYRDLHGSVPSAGAGSLAAVQEAIALGRESSKEIVGRIDPSANPQVQTSAQPTQGSRNTGPAVNLAEVFSHADNLASKNAWGHFDKDKTEKQIQADLRQLAERYGERLGEKGLEQVVERYFETRSSERERAMLQEIRLAARTAANQSFNSNPARGADVNHKEAVLNNIAQKYADVFTSANAEKLQQSMIESYKSTYDNHHQSRWDNELNWAERRYYGARRAISDAWNSAKSVAINVGVQAGNGILAISSATVAMISSPLETSARIATGVTAVGRAAVELGRDAVVAGVGAAGRVIEGIGAVCEAGLELATDVAIGAKDLVVKGASATYNFVTSADTWKSAANGIWSACKFAGRCGWAVVSCPFKASTYVAIANGIGACAKGAWAVCKFAGKCAWAVATCPFKASTYEAIWSGIKACGRGIAACGRGVAAAYNFVTDKENWQALGRGLLSTGVALSTFAVNVWRDPQAAWDTLKTTAKTVGSALATAGKYAGGLIYDIGKSLGVVDLGVGLWNAGVSQAKGIASSLMTGVALVRDFGLLAAGKITADDLKNNLKEGLKKTAQHYANSVKSFGTAVGGFARVVGEFTGINDLGRMCAAMYHGRWAEAAMHLGFAALSAGTLAATIATGGAAAGTMAAAVGLRGSVKVAGQAAIKGVSRASLETFTKSFAQQAGKGLVQKTAVGIQKAGYEVAKEAMSTTTSKIIAQGVNNVTREGASAMAREVARTGGEKAVYNVVRPATTELLQKTGKSEASLVLKQMVAAGQCTAKEARLISKGFDAALRGGNPALLRQLGNGIEAVVKKPLLEAFNTGMERGIREAAPAARSKLIQAGASAKHADELVAGMKEGTRRGAREGFEAGLKRGIHDGLKAAVRVPFRMSPGVAAGGAGTTQIFKAEASGRDEEALKFAEIQTSEYDESIRRKKLDDEPRREELNLSRAAKEQEADSTFKFSDYYDKEKQKKGAA